MARDQLTAQDLQKAFMVFREFGWRIPTGQGGISRRLLRLLEREKLISHTQARLRGGTVVNVWKWEGPK